MEVFHLVVLCTTLLVPTWAVFPGYFGYPASIGSFYPNIIPQQYQAEPLFAYTVYTAPEPAAPPAPLAQSIYTTPDDTYRGYSFQTKYEGGGKSEVVFVTGPQANQLLQKSVELFHTIVPPEVEQPTGRSLNSNATNSSTIAEQSPTTPTGPIASHYHVQFYPAHTSPFIGSVPPLQNLISSFAYSITNDIANSVKDVSENAGEAQESMVHGAIVTSPAPDTSTEDIQNSTSVPQTTVPSPSEEAPTSTTTTNTSSDTTSSNTEPSTSSKTTTEETNEISDSNPTTVAPDEIMETTSA